MKLSNDKKFDRSKLGNVISDQNIVYISKYNTRKESWKSMIEVSVLGSYKIKGKSNSVNK